MSDANSNSSDQAPDRRLLVGLAAVGLAGLAGEAMAAAPAGLPPATISTPASEVVETTNGKVRGYLRGGIHTFKGIPYGAPTGGAARFLPAKPPARWTDTLSCIAYGPVCPHPARGDWGQAETQFVYDWDDGYEGEDMLRVNVWTGTLDPSAKRPVIVWIHGGGMVSGSCQELPSYDGQNMASHGVVYASVNHRLGPLGFMDLSALGGSAYAGSGNVGMTDLVLALQWVRDNIAKFGGDPSRVTIIGQSGGGMKVSTLMTMPSARGLFHRAVVMSGSIPFDSRPADAQALALATLRELGGSGPGDLDRLRNASPKALIAAGDAAIAKLNANASPFPTVPGGPIRLPKISWGPVVDGTILPEVPFGTSAPAASRDVPLIVGTTREEFKLFSGYTEASFAEALNKGYGPKGATMLAALKKDFPGASPDVLAGILGALPWRNDAIRQATLKAQQGGAPVYNYWFTWQTAMLDGRPGAFHCIDIAFCFDNTARCEQATGNTPAARAMAKTSSTAWINFAATGNPSQPGLAWPAFDPAKLNTMVLDNKSAMVNDPASASRRSLL